MERPTVQVELATVMGLEQAWDRATAQLAVGRELTIGLFVIPAVYWEALRKMVMDMLVEPGSTERTSPVQPGWVQPV
jgi:hypothetical protein